MLLVARVFYSLREPLYYMYIVLRSMIRVDPELIGADKVFLFS